MSIKLYNLTLSAPVNIIEGKTYHKDPHMSFPFARLPKIKIISHVGSTVTATIGDDTFVQTITESEALAYINAQAGYSDIP